jgi:tripartite-type tricarboxylate transporter receptor subunit TctC
MMINRWTERSVLATFTLAVSAVFIAGGLPPARAAAAEEAVFKGKTINIIVAAGEGGGFDIAARVAGQHLARFLPGGPTIVVQNMPGANGIRAAEYIYRIAPRDGLTIAVLQPLMVLNKVLDPSARYQPQEFTWIGRMNPSPTFGVSWHTAPVHSIAQAKTSKLTLAAGGPLGPAWIIPQALNRLAGTHFVPIKGYPSATDQGLAMERGEVEGMGSASEEYLQDRGWFDQKLVNVIYTVGRERRPRAPDTPTVLELMDSELSRNVMKLLTSATDIGRAFVAPPGIPQTLTATLRQGFAQMLQDPDFIADARQRSIEIEPLPPDQLGQRVSEVMGMPAGVMEEARAAVK